MCLRSPIQRIAFSNKFSTEQPVSTEDARTSQIQNRVQSLLKSGKDSLSKGRASDAETSFLASEQGSKLLNDTVNQATSHYYLGYCNLALEKYEKAISYFQKALSVFRENKDARLVVLALQYCAESAAKQSKFTEAAAFAKEALTESKQAKDLEVLVATIKSNLASYLASDKQLNEAISFSEQSVKEFSQLFGSFHETTKQAGLVLAKLYKETGKLYHKRYDR